MTPLVFPDPSLADSAGLLGISEGCAAEDLIAAYRKGIFPWPWTKEYVGWFSPPERAILMFSEVKFSRSFFKFLRHHSCDIRCDTSFREVVSSCAGSKNRKKQRGTWITDAIIDSYCELHELGFAHSIEVFEAGVLVGGIYGVSLGRYFSGESMFYLRPNVSKLALYSLIQYLSKNGASWIDCQVAGPFSSSIGAKDIDRDDFLALALAAIDEPQIPWVTGPFIP